MELQFYLSIKMFPFFKGGTSVITSLSQLELNDLADDNIMRFGVLKGNKLLLISALAEWLQATLAAASIKHQELVSYRIFIVSRWEAADIENHKSSACAGCMNGRGR